MADNRPSLNEIFSAPPPARARPSLDQIFAPDEKAPSSTEAFLRGAGQWGTLGFADEILGAGGAGIDAIKKGTLSDVVKDYIANRDRQRQADDKAWETSPYAYGTGAALGGLATGGLGELVGGAKAATLGGRALGAAKLGAATGLGMSHADLTQGDVGGALRDSVIGGASGAASTPVIEKVVAPAFGYLGGKAKDLAGWAGKKAINAGFDIPEQMTERYLRNPEAVNNAMTKEQVGQKLADKLGEVRQDTGPLANEALSHLSTTRTPKAGLEAESAIATLSKYGEDKEASALKDRLLADLEQRRGSPETVTGRGEWGEPLTSPARAADPHADFLTEQEAHEVKKTLQQLTDWKKPLPSYQQSQARTDSGQLNSTLRADNKPYAQGMDAVAENIRTKQGLANKFGIAPDFSGANESGFQATDRTTSALRDIGNGNKIDRARVLDAMKEQGYGDLSNDVMNTLTKQRFAGGQTNGSRKAVMGGSIGGAVGHFSGMPGGGFTGAALGSVVGGSIDKYGGPIAKGLLDATLLSQKLANNPTTQKFVGAIQSAASKGQGALAATHFILSQTEPEYQKAVQSQ